MDVSANKVKTVVKKKNPQKKQNCEASLKTPKGGWGRDAQAKKAAMAKQVLVNANKENDYGFDIHPNNRYSPYKCVDCNTLDGELKQLQCAKTKYMSKIGLKTQQNLRKDLYRPTISRICKANKKLACSKNALPVHDICNCDEGGMKLTEIFPYALSFYRELGELIEGQTMSKADFEETLKKASDRIKKASDYVEARKDKIKKGAKFVAKGLLSDAKILAKPATAIAKPILKDTANLVKKTVKGVGAVTGISGGLKSAKESFSREGKLNKAIGVAKVLGAPLTGLGRRISKTRKKYNANLEKLAEQRIGEDVKKRLGEEEGEKYLKELKGNKDALDKRISYYKTKVKASAALKQTFTPKLPTGKGIVNALGQIGKTSTVKAARAAPGKIGKGISNIGITAKNVINKAADAAREQNRASKEAAQTSIARMGNRAQIFRANFERKKQELSNKFESETDKTARKAGQAALVGKENLPQEEKEKIVNEAQQKNLERAQRQTHANNRQAENFQKLFP